MPLELAPEPLELLRHRPPESVVRRSAWIFAFAGSRLVARSMIAYQLLTNRRT